jgi:ABC-type spermidine/putrescine transport system permease subunit II
MDTRSNETDLGQMVSYVGGLMTGLGVLSTTFFPFALPAVVLTLPLVLPLIVLGLPVLVVWLLVRGVRAIARKLSAHGQAHKGTAPMALREGLHSRS